MADQEAVKAKVAQIARLPTSDSGIPLDEATLSRLRRHRASLRTNLYNSGLTLPGCEAAYTAAIQCGATVSMAWEAARQHVLLELDPDITPTTHTQLRYNPGAMDREARRQDARREAIERIRALPNPFELEVAA